MRDSAHTLVLLEHFSCSPLKTAEIRLLLALNWRAARRMREAGDIAARREHHFTVMIRTPMSLVATEAVSVGLQILAVTRSGEGTVVAMTISPDGSGTLP
jgi:hypothetical protein